MTVDDVLLQGAARAFERYGYLGATFERIAAESGLSRVTLHRRGVTRERVLIELARAAAEAYRRAMQPVLTADATAASRLEQALGVLCDHAEAHLSLLVALPGQTDAVCHEDGGERLARTTFTEPFERLLRDGVRDGTLTADEPGETATVLLNQVAWSYVHLRTAYGWSPARTRSSIIALALQGVVA